MVPDQGYLKQAQELLHKHRALLIAVRANLQRRLAAAGSDMFMRI